MIFFTNFWSKLGFSEFAFFEISVGINDIVDTIDMYNIYLIEILVFLVLIF